MSNYHKFNLFSFRGKMKILHISWLAFFITFMVWFNFAPLLQAVKTSLGLTTEQIKTLLILNVALTIPARVVVGMLTDRYGPRLVYSLLLVLCAIPCFVFAFSTTFMQAALARFALGFIGAGFVIGIRLVSEWFPHHELGTAEGIYGGWGNFGSAAAAFTLPTLALWFGGDDGWRYAMAVTGGLSVIFGVIFYWTVTDTPQGATYYKSHHVGAMEVTSRGDLWLLSVKQAASSVLNTLNSWLFDDGHQAGLPQDAAVSSFSVVIIKSNTAHIFHIGDCRVYLWRDSNCCCLTQDHRRNHHDGQHYLTRALGMDSHLQVDYQTIALNVGDKLVMTTDGVHDVGDIEQSIATTMTTEPLLFGLQQQQCLERQARQLVTNVQQQGAQDNASCVVLEIAALPLPAADEILAACRYKTIPAALNVGQRIDQFVICRILDAGCRSHVYLAKSNDDNNYYVLKMPSPNMVDDVQYLDCFVREGWLGRQCQFDGIMPIFNHNAQSAFLYHVCEYLEGSTLRQWMIDNPNPPLATVRVIVTEIVAVVRTLQRQGIYHADIKPENIILGSDCRVTLIDFGSAWINGYQELDLAQTHYHPRGDLNYLAPECHAGGKPSMLSEQFSVAVVIYEMLTGSLPYPRLTPHSSVPVAIKMNYTALNHYRADLPLWLDVSLKKSCHPYAQYRYQALSELVIALATPAPLPTMMQQPLIERNPLLLWQSISLILLVIIVLQAFLAT